MIYSSASLLQLFLTLLVTSSSPPGLLGGDRADVAFHDDSKASPFLLPLLMSSEILPAVEEVDTVGVSFIRDVAVASHQLQRSSKLEEPMVEPISRLFRSPSALVRGDGVQQVGLL